MKHASSFWPCFSLQHLRSSCLKREFINLPMKQNKFTLRGSSVGEEGCWRPCRCGQVQFCSLCKDGGLLDDPLTAGLFPIQYCSLECCYCQVGLCVCTCLPFVRDCSQRPVRQRLLLGSAEGSWLFKIRKLFGLLNRKRQ